MKVTILICVLAAGGLTARAAPVEIRVAENEWGHGSAADVAKVLESAARPLWEQVPGRKFRPIVVSYREAGPITLNRKGHNGETLVMLSARDTYWAQYAYQFAHEFCHVLCHYERTAGAPSPDQWFEEALCEVASMYAVGAMVVEWRQTPPYPNWRDFAGALEKYAADLVNDPKRQLPAGLTFSQWWRTNEGDLRGKVDRVRIHVVANRLLPYFRAQPANWSALEYLHPAEPAGPGSFQDYLAQWQARCPAQQRDFVRQIAAEFGIKLAGHK